MQDISGQVSGAGDVNGDGLSDLIIGAWAADPGGVSQAGESYVVFGKADGTAIDLATVASGTGGFLRIRRGIGCQHEMPGANFTGLLESFAKSSFQSVSQ